MLKEVSGKVAMAYCLKCRKKVEMNNATEQLLRKGKKALIGLCIDCGTKVVRFIKA